MPSGCASAPSTVQSCPKKNWGLASISFVLSSAKILKGNIVSLLNKLLDILKIQSRFCLNSEIVLICDQLPVIEKWVLLHWGWSSEEELIEQQGWTNLDQFEHQSG